MFVCRAKKKIAQLPRTDDDVIIDCLLIHCPLGSPIFFSFFLCDPTDFSGLRDDD